MIRTRNLVVTAQTLVALEAFSTLNPAERENIAPHFHGRRYAVGEFVIRQHESDHGVYFVVSGSVRVTFFSETERHVSFRDLEAGAMFRELSALDGDPRSAVVESLDSTFIVSLSQSHFLKLLTEYPSLANYVMRRLARLVRLLTNRVIEISTLGVNNRVHAELLRLARAANPENNQATIKVMPTNEEFARRISTHKEAVSREITRLVKRGLIQRMPKHVLKVLDIKEIAWLVKDGGG